MIIGVSGQARSGKDTFSEFLANELDKRYGRKFIRVAFADYLKQMCKDHLDMGSDQLWGSKKEVADKRFVKNDTNEYWTPREIMQAIGEFYRSIKSDFWLDCMDKWLNVLRQDGHKDFIITDIRYLNEVKFVKNRRGVVIRLHRDNNNIEIHGRNHSSETALNKYEKFDIVVDNNGTLEDLKKVSAVVSDSIAAVENLMHKGGTV